MKELSNCDTEEELRKAARLECMSIFNEFAKKDRGPWRTPA